MRTTRLLLAVLTFTLAAACTAEPVGVVSPNQKPAFDGAGLSGSGNAVASDTTSTTGRGVGWVGTGN